MDAYDLLPEFVRTPHVPGSKMGEGDIMVEHREAMPIFSTDGVIVEEKLDGANMGVAFIDGHPVMRNRRHILNKGKQVKNPSGRQFIPAWNWLEQNRKKFDDLDGFSVYGEWLWMAQGLHYDRLPDHFVAFDVYDPKRGFLPPDESRPMLREAGFHTPPLIHEGKIEDYAQLSNWCEEVSSYSSANRREGVYLRVPQGQTWLRFKRVRHDFVPGENWDEVVVRNLLAETRRNRRKV